MRQRGSTMPIPFFPVSCNLQFQLSEKILGINKIDRKDCCRLSVDTNSLLKYNALTESDLSQITWKLCYWHSFEIKATQDSQSTLQIYTLYSETCGLEYLGYIT